MGTCCNCGHELIWQSDFSFEDYCLDDRDGIVRVLLCPNCDTTIEAYIPC